jgi:CubicO group peptidase (beta-lactamase class C family)
MGVVLLVCALARVSGQQGPPPEIREHVKAFLAAYNSGSADQWEKMAQEHFAPAALSSHSTADRKQLFDRMRGDFGQAITVDRVLRNAPDAPLELHAKGSTGFEAIIRLDLEPSAPFRIAGISVEMGGPAEQGSQVPQPDISGAMTDAELSRALDAYLTKLAADDVFSGVALVAKHGKTLFEKAYGYADRANKVPNTATTRFNLGSINKAFTKTAISQLVAQGKLSYSDPLGKLIPDYPQIETRAATVQQLLEHRAGIADFFGDAFAATAKTQFRSNEDYYKFVSGKKPLFAPGERNQYCNGCYITLGAIVQRVSGEVYEAYVAEHVFGPAGMTGAGYPQTDAIEPGVAMGYTRRSAVGAGELRSNVYTRGAAGSAAGGGYAMARDLLAFDNAIRGARLLDAGASARFLGGGIEAPFGIAGGAPGINAVLESDGLWTVVVLTNLDPPTGEQIGASIKRALTR